MLTTIDKLQRKHFIPGKMQSEPSRHSVANTQASVLFILEVEVTNILRHQQIPKQGKPLQKLCAVNAELERQKVTTINILLVSKKDYSNRTKHSTHYLLG